MRPRYGSKRTRLELALIEVLYRRQILVKVDSGTSRALPKLCVDGPHVDADFIEDTSLPEILTPKTAAAALRKRYGGCPRVDKVGEAMKHLSEYGVFINLGTRDHPKWKKGLGPDWNRYYAIPPCAECGGVHQEHFVLPHPAIVLRPLSHHVGQLPDISVGKPRNHR